MNIYKNKINNKNYLIENVIHDIYHWDFVCVIISPIHKYGVA